jgi:DNA primase
MDPEARAKYLNGPETSLFFKGRLLYGLPEARKLLHAGGDDTALVVVEGYMDVIACQRAGIAAVAPLGTALTEDQMEVLWRLHPEPTLCFDGDGAGQRAADRVIDRALPLLRPGRSFRFCAPSGGKDPDDILRDQGPDVLRAQLSVTVPFAERLFVRGVREAGALDTPERKTSLKAKLRTLSASIADKDLAWAYKDDLLARYEALWPLARPAQTVSDLGRGLARQRWDNRKSVFAGATPEGKAAAKRLSSQPNALMAALAVAAIRDPKVVQDRLEVLSLRGFGDASLDQIANEIVSLQMDADVVQVELVKKRISVRGFDDRALQDLQRIASESRVPQLVKETQEDELRRIWSEAFDLLLRVEALEAALAQAKRDVSTKEDMATIRLLKDQRDTLKRSLDSGSWFEGREQASLH